MTVVEQIVAGQVSTAHYTASGEGLSKVTSGVEVTFTGEARDSFSNLNVDAGSEKFTSELRKTGAGSTVLVPVNFEHTGGGVYLAK